MTEFVIVCMFDDRFFFIRCCLMYVTTRSNRQERIFVNGSDRLTFLDLLSK